MDNEQDDSINEQQTESLESQSSQEEQPKPKEEQTSKGQSIDTTAVQNLLGTRDNAASKLIETIANQQRQIEELTRNRQAPVEEQTDPKEIFENPRKLVGDIVRSELASSLKPILEVVGKVQARDAYAEAKQRFAATPLGQKIVSDPALNNIFDQMTGGVAANDNALAMAGLATLGIASVGGSNKGPSGQQDDRPSEGLPSSPPAPPNRKKDVGKPTEDERVAMKVLGYDPNNAAHIQDFKNMMATDDLDQLMSTIPTEKKK